MNDLSKRLKAARTVLGLTQKELASAVNAKIRGYQDNESGKTTPGSNVITGFVGLGINANWLLTGEGEMSIKEDLKEGQKDYVRALLDDDQQAEARINAYAAPRVKQIHENFALFKKSLSSLGEASEFWATELTKAVVDNEFGQQYVQEFIDFINTKRSFETVDVAEFNEEYILTPGYHVSVSTGHSALNDDAPIGRQLAFRREWINHRNLNPSSLAVVFAKGDSMEPTIHSGNTLLVDISDTNLTDGSIFVLRVGENLFAKRLQQRFDGTIELLSDNKEYPAQLVKPDELEQLAIIGKVVWIGKDLY